MLKLKNGMVRSIDIVHDLDYSKPSVSRAVGILKEGGYICVDRAGLITLTETGQKTARKIYERHTLLTDFLVKLGVDEKTAAEDACRIEHVISKESFDAIKRHVKEALIS